ncbi:MAG: DUF3536 domain-containing protein [Candidatus Omnitrophica bacterium]|nr:DUF3536 domain-containing protein [Candidatus Omnitrophota bacterium]
MNKYICIHAHFYQPPRENPWLEEIERQDSAYPYHDWNERITSECYAPNSAARILGDEGRIQDIVSNYSHISFNFGPTLLYWMSRMDPDVYHAILKADQESIKFFSGHGSAIAQAYNHMILPLATREDKETQIVWGIEDFKYHFNRPPEGMWLPETAVDLESLDIMAAQGIRYTILAPRQAKRIRKIGDKKWRDVSGSRVNPRRPYLCRLFSGRQIVLFFYDGPISQSVAFEGLLYHGEHFANRLLGGYSHDKDDQFVHIATDGETYGHHHPSGDMALAYCINHIKSLKLARITNYGEYLDSHAPEFEVEIFEHSSWSCEHGIERWRNNCGCHSGKHPDWNQEWRAPLRGALDWLRDNAANVYVDHMRKYCDDVWTLRNKYVEVILDRSSGKIDHFLTQNISMSLSEGDRLKVRQLLEMQRFSMLMFTSCGWFFDEVSGIETVQILQYAARVIQLAETISSIPFDQTFCHLLEKIPSNIAEFENARNIYHQLVKPAIVDLARVGAHYTISSLFETYDKVTSIYCYTAQSESYDLMVVGSHRLASGQAMIQSNITGAQASIYFVTLHLGDHNFIGGVIPVEEGMNFQKIAGEIKSVFKKSDIAGTIALIEKTFHNSHYSLWHLFKDEQRKILYQILCTTLEDIESSLRQINQHHYSIIQVIRQLGIPLPQILANTVLASLNTDIMRVLGADPIDFKRLQELVREVIEWSLEIDQITLEFMVRKRLNGFMADWRQNPREAGVLNNIVFMLDIVDPLSLKIDFWRAQNDFFLVAKNNLADMRKKEEAGEEHARCWMKMYRQLAQHLTIKIE